MNDERLAELRVEFEERQSRNLMEELVWGTYANHSGYVSKADGEFINWLCNAAYRTLKGAEKAREPKQGEWQDGFNAGWTAKEADRLGDCDGCKFDNPNVVARCQGCCRNYADGYVAKQTDCPWG